MARPIWSADAQRHDPAPDRNPHQERLGKPIWPHLFRDIAVTELVDFAPDEIGIAPDLLGHADLETTQRYYVLAEGMTAHVRVQEVIAARRRAAAARDSTGTSGA